jgi:O-antigen ligase
MNVMIARRGRSTWTSGAVLILGVLCALGIFTFGPLLTSAIAVVALMATAIVLYPWLSVALLVVCAPLTNFFSSYFSIGGIPGGAIVRDLLFAGAIARWGIGALMREFDFFPRSLNRWFLLFTGLYVSVLLLYVAAAPQHAAGLLAARSAGLYMVLVWIAATLPQRGDKFSAVLYAVAGIGFVMGLIGVAEVLTDGGALAVLGFRADYATDGLADPYPYFLGIRRATGGMGNFIIFGAYMMMQTVLTLALLQSSKRRVTSLFLYCSLALGVASVLLSFSRGAWAAALLAVLLVMLMGSGPAIRKWLPLFVAAGIILLTSVTVGDAFSKRVLSTDNLSQASNMERFSQLDEVVGTALNHPLGLGLGTQGSARGRDSAPAIVTDSFYLQVLAEMGWPMLVAVTLGLIWLTRILWYRWRVLPSGWPKNVSGAMFAITLAIVLSNTLENFYDSRLFNMLFWSYAGLIVGLGETTEKSR